MKHTINNTITEIVNSRPFGELKREMLKALGDRLNLLVKCIARDCNSLVADVYARHTRGSLGELEISVGSYNDMMEYAERISRVRAKSELEFVLKGYEGSIEYDKEWFERVLDDMLNKMANKPKGEQCEK